MRPAGRGVPLRHDHGRHHIRRSAQPARHVHPPDAEHRRHRHRAQLRSTSSTPQGHRQRAHFDGLPVEFIAEAVATLGGQLIDGFQTYHVMNPHDDGIGIDEYVDWLIEAGYPIERIDDFSQWLQQFETRLRALPDHQRQHSVLQMLQMVLHHTKDLHPLEPTHGSYAPTHRFQAAVQDSKIGADNDNPHIPHVSAPVITKYATDLQHLGLL